MGDRALLVELPDGTQVWARLSRDVLPDSEDADGYDDYADVGALDTVAARVHRLQDLVTGVAASVRDAAAQAAPDEVSVEFGVEFAVKSGAVVSMLAGGESTTALKVTLTWRDRFGRSSPLPHDPVPPAAAAPQTVPGTAVPAPAPPPDDASLPPAGGGEGG